MQNSTQREYKPSILDVQQANSKPTPAMVIAAIFVSLFLAGCNEPAASSSSFGSEETKAVIDFAIYEGPDKEASFAATYNGHCSGRSCIIEVQPSSAPLKKTNGEPLCVVGKYELQAVLTAHFSRDGHFQGAGCMIGGDDYDQIKNHYGRANVYKRYRNQRGVYEDFLTWKTNAGFITTYKEVLGRSPSGGVSVSYHAYLGPVEHRYYSEYAYD